MVKTNDYIREFVTITFIQRRIILGTAIIVWIITLLIAFLWPPTYAAVSTVLVKHKGVLRSPATLEKNVKFSVPRVDERDVFSEMQLATSYELVKETVETLHRKGLIFKHPLTQRTLRADIALIKGNLKSELTPKSDVFKITLTWHDPIEAEIILQTLMDRYQIYRSNIYNPKQEEEFFKNQLIQFDRQLTKLENNLLELAKLSKSPNPTQKITNNLLIEKNLEQALNTLINSYVERKSYIQFIENALHTKSLSTFSFINNINIGDYGKNLARLILRKEQLLTIYSPKSDKIQLINEEIRNTYAGLKNEVRRYVEGEKARLKGMEMAIDSLKMRLKHIRDVNIETYENLMKAKKIQRQIRLLEESYNTFSRRWEEAKISRNTTADKIFSVSILGRAHASMTPVFPNKRTFVPIGFFAGILIGFTIGYLREFFDHTFKRPEDVNNYLGLPTIFSIPEF